MGLTTGTRLGPYEIQAPLGTGGPASARVALPARELRRGLAAALARTRP